MKVVIILVSLSVVALAEKCTDDREYIVTPANHASAPYDTWAHSHWVWLSSGESNQNSTMRFVQEWRDHNIPVGAINIDAEWETKYNTLVFDRQKFPDPQGLVNYFHGLGLKVIFWICSIINTDSPDWPEADSKRYLVRSALDGKSAVIKWWLGHGSMLDYENPEAVAWWHKKMDPVLALGIDGWKVDGTDPYLLEIAFPIDYKNRSITYRQYADAFYGDFFDYSRKVLGPRALIMSRPMDTIEDRYFPNIYLPFSPRRVVFSGWVGDNDPTWDGIQKAMKSMLMSGYANYPNYGSDIGGYRGGKRYKEHFVRWAQLGAFNPLMENGGNDQHRPWAFDTAPDTTVADMYRRFTAAHYQLGPYFLTTGTNAYEKNTSSMIPLAKPPPVDFKGWPSTYDYFLGKDMFVSPIVENVTTCNITFPEPQSTWTSYWNSAERYRGGQTLRIPCPFSYFPVFLRSGSIVPLHVTNALAGHGDEHSADALTILISRPELGVHSTDIREFQSGGRIVTYSYSAETRVLEITATGRSKCDVDTSAHKPLLFLIEGVQTRNSSPDVYQNDSLVGARVRALAVARSTQELQQLSDRPDAFGAVFFDSSRSALFVRPADSMRGVRLTVNDVRVELE